MMIGESECRAHIEALEEELRLIPRHQGNVQKIRDREDSLAFYRRTLARMKRTQRAFVEKRHELLSRCRQYGSCH